MAPFALRITTVVVALAALAEGFAYLLLVINRSGLVPGWLALIATVGVFALGWLAVLATVGTAVALACWLRTARARAYSDVGTRDPRPAWQVWVYCLVPVVNLVAAPVLVLELLRVQDRAAGVRTDRREQFIRMWWVGWAVTTIVTVGCVAYARADGGLQHQADAMLYTALTYALSAVFVAATAWVVGRVDGGPRAQAREKEKRWVAV